MALWIGIALLTAIALVMMVLPLLKSEKEVTSSAEFDLSVYRDQLAEVDRDMERGLLNDEQADAARLEIERRMLTTSEMAQKAKKANSSAGLAKTMAILTTILLPIGGVSLYTVLGNPAAPDVPFAERDLQKEQDDAQEAEIGRLLDQLRARLKENPNDSKGWLMLGRSMRAMGKFDDAIDAYSKAASLLPMDADILANLGEVHLLKADGQVNEDAQATFDKALRLNPKHPKSRFYVGYIQNQKGDKQGALDTWKAIVADAPKDAPYLEEINLRIAEVSKELGIDPTPPAETSSAKELSEQEEMIMNMVNGLAERLKSEPDDLQGWLRLGRSYVTLGKDREAVDAFKNAARLAPEDKAVLTEYASSLMGVSEPGVVSDDMAGVLGRIQKIDPKDSNVLWYLGLYAKQKDDLDTARKYWTELLTMLTPETVPYVRLKQQLDSL